MSNSRIRCGFLKIPPRCVDHSLFAHSVLPVCVPESREQANFLPLFLLKMFIEFFALIASDVGIEIY